MLKESRVVPRRVNWIWWKRGRRGPLFVSAKGNFSFGIAAGPCAAEYENDAGKKRPLIFSFRRIYCRKKKRLRVQSHFTTPHHVQENGDCAVRTRGRREAVKQMEPQIFHEQHSRWQSWHGEKDLVFLQSLSDVSFCVAQNDAALTATRWNTDEISLHHFTPLISTSEPTMLNTSQQWTWRSEPDSTRCRS